MYKFAFDVVRSQFHPGDGRYVLVFMGDGVRQGSRELKALDGEPVGASFEVCAEKEIVLDLAVISPGGGKRIADSVGLPVIEASELYAGGSPIQRSLASGWKVVVTSIRIEPEETSEGEVDQPDTDVLEGDSELASEELPSEKLNYSESESEPAAVENAVESSVSETSEELHSEKLPSEELNYSEAESGSGEASAQ